MPKIIENLQARLIAEARRQVTEDGYSAVTVRSVASGCGVGVGTVYNYFSSKDDLTAAFMLEDWQICMAAIREVSRNAEIAEPVVRRMFDQLGDFARQHRGIFQDAAAVAVFAGSFGKYHRLLRTQLAEPLRKFCESDFAAEFISESLLAWTMDGRDFEEIYGQIRKLL